MNLLDQIRAARETAHVALLPQPGFTDATGLSTSLGMEGLMAAAGIEDQIDRKIFDATDADLLAAYERTSGEPDNPEADMLLAEIQRRGLDT